jgi:hypothetical protein
MARRPGTCAATATSVDFPRRASLWARHAPDPARSVRPLGSCTGETYKKVVKMTFAKGATLKDPSRLFNSSLDGNTRRAIDVHEGEKIDVRALKALIREAVALNVSGKKAASPKRARR